MPINKRIWTSTFALLSGGLTLLAFALLYWFLDIRSAPRWARPATGFFRIFGTNAIAAFVLSSVITATLDAIHLRIGSTGSGVAVSLHHAAYQHLFAPWLPLRIGSLAYALTIVALNATLLYPLYRKRIYLRI
jgi:predicted acyltransferase